MMINLLNNNMQTFSSGTVRLSLLQAAKKISGKLLTDEFIKESVSTENPNDISPLSSPENAKNCCINILKKKNTESYYIVDQDKNIIEFREGGKTSCNIFINNEKYPKSSLQVIHSHPTFSDKSEEYTLPISVDDFHVLNSNIAIKEVTAIDKNGKFSKLEKSSNFKPIKKRKLKILVADFYSYLYNSMTTEEKEKIQILKKYCNENPNNSDSISLKIMKDISSQQHTKTGAIAIHKFWLDNAEKYGLSYSTNLYG